MRPGRSFRFELDLSPEAFIEALGRDPRVLVDARGRGTSSEQILARVDGRWLELRHADSPGLTPVLCVELEALSDGGTAIGGRWVHGPWEVGMRALFLLYACALVIGMPVLWSLPSATLMIAAVAVGAAGLAALAVSTLRPAQLRGARQVEAESICSWLSEVTAPHRRGLGPSGDHPFRRPALPA